MTKRKDIRISLCYIVKDEGAVLERSLSSAEHAVNEIIVVDTGSTDLTIEIARAHGARVFSYAWRDHFADARNFALDRATGDWIIFLDADEYFTEGTKRNIRRVIERADSDGAVLLALQLKNYDADTGDYLVDVYTPRIFRRLPSIRYAGRIHEQLMQNGKLISNVSFVPEKELCLIHTGYSSHLSPAKAERNLRLLKLDLAESKRPEEQYASIAEAYEGVGDFRNAVKYAKLDIERGRQPVTYASRSYRILIRLLRDEPQRHREILCRAVEDFPELPEFHAELAESFAAAGDFEGAVAEADAALQACADYHSLEPMQFDEAMRKTLQNRRKLWQQRLSENQKYTVSACVIVKDEEKDIASWLENARRYADERIVIDTGSSDHTADIARRDGAEVHVFPWGNDFSAAKNAAIERAHGDWIAFLDADEVFLHPEAVHREIAAVLDIHPDAEALRVTIINVDEDDGTREIHRFRAIRIFRRRDDIRYRNPVHEELVRPDGALMTYDAENLHILHTGYSTGRILRKHRRNLEILKRDIEKNGESPRHYRYLASCFLGLGEYERALSYAKLALKAPLKSSDSESDLYRTVLRAMEVLKYPVKDRLEWTEKSIGFFPDLPDFHVEKGLLLLREKRYEEAGDALITARHLADRGQREASAFRDMEDEVSRGLAEISWQKGDRKAAAEELRQALEVNPHNEESLELFAEMHGEETEGKIADLLEKIVGNNKAERRFLARWAEHHGRIGLYRIFAERLKSDCGSELPRLELYRAAEMESPEELRSRIIGGLAGNFSRLVLSLIRLEPVQKPSAAVMRKAVASLLPPAAAGVWKAYMGEADRFDDEGFAPFLPWFIEYAEDVQLTRFASLAQGISDACLYDAAVKTMEAERWQPALEIFTGLPADSSLVTAEFWKRVGICLYHVGDGEAALESLKRAASMGDASKELESYIAWAKDVLRT